MQLDYLALLDSLLLEGIGLLGQPFLLRQTDTVVETQTSEGGFTGRRGGSDLYYTDFAVRTLTLIAPDHPALSKVRSYLTRFVDAPPDNLIDRFCFLNLHRNLSCPVAALPSLNLPTIESAFTSAYDLFLSALCEQMIGRQEIDVPANVNEILSASEKQTSLIAAATGYRMLRNELSEDQANEATQRLCTLQGPEGGFMAHADTPSPDLLSTFSALTTLCILGKESNIRLGQTARFLRDCAHREGGFGACPEDPETDVEYDYYGLGSLGLLNLLARG